MKILLILVTIVSLSTIGFSKTENTMNDINKTVFRHLEFLAENDPDSFFESLHPKVKSHLEKVFKEKREENNLNDKEVFREFFEENYFHDDYADKEFKIIGIINENSDICHVVVREKHSEHLLEKSWVETLSFHKEGEIWCSLLTPYMIANLATIFEIE